MLSVVWSRILESEICLNTIQDNTERSVVLCEDTHKQVVSSFVMHMYLLRHVFAAVCYPCMQRFL